MMKCEKIIDINDFIPFDNQKAFFLDTNVLYWFSYPRYGITKKHVKQQATPYYDFIDNLVANGNPLFTSVYNITEMLHVIEKNEFDLFTLNHPEADWTIKDFRKRSSERSQLKSNLSTALSNANNICKIINFNFTYNTMEQFVQDLEYHRCDTFDYAILKHCINDGKLNVVSDDNDFTTMEQIFLYTANPTSLAVP